MLSIGMDLTIETDNNGIVKKYKSKVADLFEEKLCIYYPLSVADSKPAFCLPGLRSWLILLVTVPMRIHLSRKS